MHFKAIKKFVDNTAFGIITPSGSEKKLYDMLNMQIVKLCQLLPKHMQNPALLFMMNYSNIKLGEPLDFFSHYYAPTWTIIPHIIESKHAQIRLSDAECELALCGQAMALFLHSIDDHLTDGQLQPSHLTLLLRSKAWECLKNTISEFSETEDIPAIEELINEYYEGICPDNETATAQEYWQRFKHEIATWYIMPLLTVKKCTGNIELFSDIKTMTGLFGSAWRILDDIQDIEDDMATGTKSAVYYSLNENTKKLWIELSSGSGQKNVHSHKAEEIQEEVCREIGQNDILTNLAMTACSLLAEAENTANKIGMNELALQFRTLAEPLKENTIFKDPAMISRNT
jgi:hypothetical protein